VLAAKQLELLRELVPNSTVVGLLADPTSRGATDQLNEVEAAARPIGQQMAVYAENERFRLSLCDGNSGPNLRRAREGLSSQGCRDAGSQTSRLVAQARYAMAQGREGAAASIAATRCGLRALIGCLFPRSLLNEKARPQGTESAEQDVGTSVRAVSQHKPHRLPTTAEGSSRSPDSKRASRGLESVEVPPSMAWQL
jgi:hypothetical protein